MTLSGIRPRRSWYLGVLAFSFLVTMAGGMRIGWLMACVVAWLVAGTGCNDEKICKSGLDCEANQICAGTYPGPYHCLAACSTEATCPTGFRCEAVDTPVCIQCDVVTRACVLAPPAPSLR